MPNRPLLSILILMALCSLTASADPWEIIKPSFTPPPDVANQYGGFPSPLKFDDGRVVKSPQDWPARRAEILAKWHGLMGAWPAELAHPTIEIIDSTPRENFIQHRIRVTIAKDRTADGYLLIPSTATKDKPAAAVFVPFYEPETSINQPPKGTKDVAAVAFRAYAYELAKRGFVTLAIGSPGGDARKPDTAGQVLQPLSYLAYISHNCAGALASRPEVDPKRIGVVGHSYGGKWAMFASCLSERFAAAVWSDPGIVFDEPRGNVNYWEPWYLGLDPALPTQRKPGLITAANPRTGPYKTMMENHMDLTDLHALMAPRPFLVSGGSEDTPARWPALNHAIAVNKLLGQENKVAMHNRKAHSPDEAANAVVFAFFEYALIRK